MEHFLNQCRHRHKKALRRFNQEEYANRVAALTLLLDWLSGKTEYSYEVKQAQQILNYQEMEQCVNDGG